MRGFVFSLSVLLDREGNSRGGVTIWGNAASNIVVWGSRPFASLTVAPGISMEMYLSCFSTKPLLAPV
jgi:hypothetical protein